MKKYRWEQEQIAGMKEYIARFGHGSAKLARQAQSKEKVLAKMVRGGLTERVEADRTVKLTFTDVGKLPPPVLQFSGVSFGYSRDKILYGDVDLGVDLDSRVAIVGPNGTGESGFFVFSSFRVAFLPGFFRHSRALMRRSSLTHTLTNARSQTTPQTTKKTPTGKSTLLKLMTGQLEPVDGMVKRHNHLRIGMYHQHLTDLLDPEITPLEYMSREFPDAGGVEKVRSMIGRFGVTGPAQTLQIKHLSDGLKSRVVFSWLAQKTPHMLLLDERELVYVFLVWFFFRARPPEKAPLPARSRSPPPLNPRPPPSKPTLKQPKHNPKTATNHLDMETIDSLAHAINEWDGGMVLVSHDFRLIGQVAKEIWEVRGGAVSKWPGDIQSYKRHLKKQHEALKK
jgi:ATP-binding cassette subfamily F protein 2